MADVAGYKGAIYVMSTGSSVAMTNEVLTDSGDHTTYFDNNTAHIYWDDSSAPTVQTSPDGTTWTTQAANTYTVQYPGGKIIWNSAKPAGTQVRLSSGGKFFAYTTLALGTDWEFDGSRDFVDVTPFQATRARVWLPTLYTGTFMIKLWWIDNTFLANIQSGFRYCLSGVLPSGNRLEAYMYTKDEKLHDALTSAVEDQVSFQVTGNWYYS